MKVLAFLAILMLIPMSVAFAEIEEVTLEKGLENEEILKIVGTETQGNQNISLIVYDPFRTSMFEFTAKSDSNGKFEVNTNKKVREFFTHRGDHEVIAYTSPKSDEIQMILHWSGSRVNERSIQSYEPIRLELTPSTIGNDTTLHVFGDIKKLKSDFQIKMDILNSKGDVFPVDDVSLGGIRGSNSFSEIIRVYDIVDVKGDYFVRVQYGGHEKSHPFVYTAQPNIPEHLIGQENNIQETPSSSGSEHVVIVASTNDPTCAENDTCLIPSEIYIKPGDWVKFEWRSYKSGLHDMVAGSGETGPDKDAPKPEGTVYDKEGYYPYFVMVNPWITGTIIVELVPRSIVPTPETNVTEPPKSPLKQLKAGVPIQDIQCNEGKVLIHKQDTLSPACVGDIAANDLVFPPYSWATMRLGMPAEEITQEKLCQWYPDTPLVQKNCEKEKTIDSFDFSKLITYNDLPDDYFERIVLSHIEDPENNYTVEQISKIYYNCLAQHNNDPVFTVLYPAFNSTHYIDNNLCKWIENEN